MSSIGLSEVLMVLMIALLVLGPKQLPRTLQHFNHFTRRIKQIKTAIVREFNHE